MYDFIVFFSVSVAEILAQPILGTALRSLAFMAAVSLFGQFRRGAKP